MARPKGQGKEAVALALSVSDAADRLGELLARVADGETVVITRYNKPAARLVAVESSRAKVA